MDKRALCWIGRFAGNNGYATVTRSMFSLVHKNFDCVGIDINTREVFGKRIPGLEIIQQKDNLQVLFPQDYLVTTIVHETLDNWKSLEIDGKTCVNGYTVAETAMLHFDWQKNITLADRIWTASEFNREIFGEHTPFPIDLVYHPVNAKKVGQAKGNLRIDGLNSFVFLSVVSNFNRKDIASTIKAYTRAFSLDDDVSLVIKLPGNTKNAHLQSAICDVLFPEIDLTSSELPHIVFLMSNLSDEDMHGLYSLSDCVVSAERAKGFDLITAEAMALGIPAIGIGWSANLEYMNSDNSYLIAPAGELVSADKHLVTENRFYAASKWATFDIDELAASMKSVVENPEDAEKRGRAGQKTIETQLSEEAVLGQIEEAIKKTNIWETKSYRPARLRVWEKKRDRVSERSRLRQVHWEKLTPNERSLFNKEVDEDEIEYIEKRRTLWSKYGAVMPPKDEIARIAGLKDIHLDLPIIIVGNGPSLKKVDFESLVGTHSFAANRISLMFDKTSWRPTYFTALDWLVTPDNYEEYNALPSEITKFFPMRFTGLLDEGERTFWYESSAAGPLLEDRFQTDASNAIKGLGTVVTGMLQLAWHMGYRRFYLIGCDASYSVPKTVIQSGGDKFGTGNQVHLQSVEDDDNNHFDSRYFGKGKHWHDPNVDEMKRGFYNCQKFIEWNGGQLLDATVGGKLDFIPKVDLADVIKSEKW
ncbi:MAG: hypothetical protein AAGB23_00405 [Pseudomonadota bacterium]